MFTFVYHFQCFQHDIFFYCQRRSISHNWNVNQTILIQLSVGFSFPFCCLPPQNWFCCWHRHAGYCYFYHIPKLYTIVFSSIVLLLLNCFVFHLESSYPPPPHTYVVLCDCATGLLWGNRSINSKLVGSTANNNSVQHDVKGFG